MQSPISNTSTRPCATADNSHYSEPSSTWDSRSHALDSSTPAGSTTSEASSTASTEECQQSWQLSSSPHPSQSPAKWLSEPTEQIALSLPNSGRDTPVSSTPSAESHSKKDLTTCSATLYLSSSSTPSLLSQPSTVMIGSSTNSRLSGEHLTLRKCQSRFSALVWQVTWLLSSPILSSTL